MAGGSQRVYLGYRAAAALLQLLPRRAATALGVLVGTAWWAASPTRRRVVQDNLTHVTPAASGALVRRAFRSYARYWVDGATIDLADHARFAADFVLRGEQHLTGPLGEGRGVILALPHLGSWEIGGMYGLSIGHPLIAVAEVLEPPELFAFFVAERRRIGLEVVPADAGALGALLPRLRSGAIVALVADRVVRGEGVAVEFFGARTTFPGGPALLALRSGAALVPCAIYQRPHGRFEASARPELEVAREGGIREDVARLTGALAREFEELVAAAPEQWHAFQAEWPQQ